MYAGPARARVVPEESGREHRHHRGEPAGAGPGEHARAGRRPPAHAGRRRGHRRSDRRARERRLMSNPLESWVEEQRSAYLYRACAEAEAGTARADLFTRLAGEAEA